MMPFSVLRTWFGGLFSWIVLGVGAYVLWEWADGIDPPPHPREVRESATATVTPQVTAEADHDRDRQGGWPYLAVGLACLAFSFGGSLATTLLLGRPGGSTGKRITGKSKTIDRPDGSQIFVNLYGPEGPAIVFTHGWSLESSVWNEIIEKLSDNHRIIVWDLAGLGNSKGPNNGNFSLEKMAEDLAAVAEASGKGPLILVGHSIGGMIVQTFCRLHRKQLGERVAGIVLLHTTYTNPLRTAFGRSFWKAIEKPLLIPLNYLSIWLAPLAWLSNWQSYLNGNLHLMTRLASFSGRQTWGQLNHGAWLAAKAWPAVVARGNLAMLTFDEQQILPGIEIPALVIAARHDRMTCPDASDRLAKLLPSSIESAVDAGHLGFWEQPEEVCELIEEFAQRVTTTAPTDVPARENLNSPVPLK